MLIASAVICGVVLVLLFVAVLKRRGADGGVPDTRRGGLWIPAVGGIAIPIVRTANELHIPVGSRSTSRSRAATSSTASGYPS